jgi:iron(III) transport system ATP-binding protein
MDHQALVIQNLAKDFAGRRVLDNVSLAVGEGECLALVGPSGCGKTTVLRLIAGLDDADFGCIRLDGLVASNPGVVLAPNQRGVGMVFQDLALWPHLTACQNVEFMLPSTVRGRKSRMEKAKSILRTVQMDNNLDHPPHQLSRGQQQRVALARALANEPAILLLDEPFASQDAKLKMQMVDLVGGIRRSTSMTVIYVTHTTEEIPRLADRVATIEAGTIRQVVSVDDFMNQKSNHENA